MGIVDEVKEILSNENYMENDNMDLIGALQMYHDLVKQKLIVPRDNQLLPDMVYNRNSNFM